MTWIAPDVERSEGYPERRNEPEQEMLRDWLDWHRATLLRKCAGLGAAQLATRAGPPTPRFGIMRNVYVGSPAGLPFPSAGRQPVQVLPTGSRT